MEVVSVEVPLLRSATIGEWVNFRLSVIPLGSRAVVLTAASVYDFVTASPAAENVASDLARYGAGGGGVYEFDVFAEDAFGVGRGLGLPLVESGCHFFVGDLEVEFEPVEVYFD